MASHTAAELSAPAPAPRNPFAFLRSLRGDSAGDTSATVTRAEIATIFDPSPATLSSLERDLVAALVPLPDAALSSSPDATLNAPPSPPDAFYLRAALLARKGDVSRAAALVRNFSAWRQRLGDANPVSSPAILELLQRGLIVSPGTRDRKGRAIVCLSMNKLDSDRFSPLDVVRTVAFVYDWTMRRYPWAMTHGFCVMQDAAGVSLLQLDHRIPREMRAAFSQTLPVRIACMNILSPPAFFAFIFRTVQRFMGAKLKARISLVSNEKQLLEIVDAAEMIDLPGLGGVVEWTPERHSDWVDGLVEDCKTWGGINLLPVEDQIAAC